MINRRFKANRPKIVGDTNIKPYLRVISDIIKESDIVLEVLDARMPELSRNSEIESLVKSSGKKLILILNKSDLVSEKDLRKNYQNLIKENPTFVISSKDKMGTKRLREYIFMQAKNNGNEKFRIGILGYPNTGKSSVINSLTLRKKAKVTSKAGTTHGQQWANFTDKISIIDSPGIIPLNENDETRLALIASKNVEKIKNPELVAHTIINLFSDKTNIEKLYEIKINSDDPQEIIEQVGNKKRYIKKHGEVEIIRASSQIIRDWQSGKLRL